MANPTFTAEDEALLRAIIDDPADTTARLVYADWLDDQTHLRVCGAAFVAQAFQPVPL